MLLLQLQFEWTGSIFLPDMHCVTLQQAAVLTQWMLLQMSAGILQRPTGNSEEPTMQRRLLQITAQSSPLCNAKCQSQVGLLPCLFVYCTNPVGDDSLQRSSLRQLPCLLLMSKELHGH